MTTFRHRFTTGVILCAGLATLAGCTDGYDWDMRDAGHGFDTTSAVRGATATRPLPDGRGVISYPSYQVAVARRGDTVASVAARIGADSRALASYNGLAPDVPLREGEVLALPSRLSGGGMAGTGADGVDVTAIATSALDRAGSGATAPASTPAPGPEPLRHHVARGETAYSIARLYNVPVRSLADWNGLGPDLSVREGQYLLIPVVTSAPAPATDAITPPGKGSLAPEPPSAATPLPAEKTLPAATPTPGVPASPDLAKGRTAASASRLGMPVDGKIIRGYAKNKNEGLDIAASAGSPVLSAADGTVAAVTEDTKKISVILIRHADGISTIYANVDGIKVARGAKVKRGQTIAQVRAGDPAFMHFEVLQGSESVDPAPFLQ